jgi:hypothetical protein
MIVSVIFHGAWLFFISEKDDRIVAIAPDESKDHRYGVGSVTANTFENLPSDDYDFLGVVGDSAWYPNREYIPMVSAKNQGLEQADPEKNRYCRISLPFPSPFNIFPLEPYDTVGFLHGKAVSDLKDLKQFPSVYCFAYECSSLESLRFESENGRIEPRIPANHPPYDNTANLHVFATYWKPDPTPGDDKEQMERCFAHMTQKLLRPKLDLNLVIDPSKVKPLPYSLPPGVTQAEVELNDKSGKVGIFYGGGHNCQNTGLFLYDTSGMQLP